MKKRILPYGYRYENGMVIVDEQEKEVVISIDKAYLAGDSLLNIADRLNTRHVEYMPGVMGWNKARVKRIIEDDRYLGQGAFPTIIDEEIYTSVQKVKENRNTQKNMDRQADIYQLHVPVYCQICRCVMKRYHDSRAKYAQKWICTNQECGNKVVKRDEELFNEITELQNKLISNPQIVTNSIGRHERSLEIQKIECEIKKTLERFDFDKGVLKKKLLACVSLKYQDIPSEIYISKQLQADFADASPLCSFSADLFTRTVKAIQFDDQSMVNLILLNGQQIGKEKIDG